jgi:amino acid adenylation domain-containing protein
MTPILTCQLFEDHVNHTPQNTAVVMGDESISYKVLNQRANQIAHYLIKKGVEADQLIGIRMHRSIQMITALLGVLKAGGAYLPLDPKYPPNRLKYIIEDAKPRIILNDKNQYSLPVSGEEVLDILNLENEIAKEPDTNPDLKIASTQLAYCIYTSGSTGTPKGVLIEHHSLANFLKSAKVDYTFTSSDRILQFASLNFDTSIEEIFPPLISGAALVLRQDDMTDSMQRFLQESAHHRISILDLPTAFWHELVIYLEESKEILPDSLRLIIIGGERVSPDLINTWHRLNQKHVRLDNTYGLTECTCVSTRCELTPEERRKYAGREVTIGKAIANTNLYILDDKLNPVAERSAGELFIGGDNLARGYLNLPDLTHERFLGDPFFSSGKRMYKTGDLILRRSDGTLEYLGRNDDQIKIWGFRIEPGEIESAILEKKTVKQVIVIKKADLSGNDHLVAYLKTQSGIRISNIELWNFLAEKLPAHMIPDYFFFVDAFPLTPNQKIDKKSLPEPDWNKVTKIKAVPPSTEAEIMLLKIWEEALGRKGFGIDDDFFDLGGNSILAARMATALERKTQQPIPMAVLVETQTIRGLAKSLTDRGWERDWQSIVPMKDKGTKPPLFLVHAMWGDILSYRRLVNHMEDKNQPVYGIRAIGFDGKTAPFTNLKAMAAFYVQEIKKIYPAGPYYLGGYSFGGTVAYEMAQQLVADGDRVAVLAMFDTVLLNSLPAKLMPTGLEKFRNEFIRSLLVIRKWFRISSDQKTERLSDVVKAFRDRIKAKLTGKRFISPGEIEGEERKAAMPESHRIVHEANAAADKSYIAKPYPGKVTLFNARERQWSDLINPLPIWKKMALGGVESINVPGKHYSILDEPNAAGLAEALESVLQENQSHQLK